MFVRKGIARRLEVPDLPTVDQSRPTPRSTMRSKLTRPLVQTTQARAVVAELKLVNIRNGFPPAIRKSSDRTPGEAT